MKISPVDAQAQGQAKTKGESPGVRRTYPRRLRSLDSRLWDAREYLRSRLSLLEPTETSFAPEPGSADAARAWAADELILKLIQHAEPGPDPRCLPNGERELEKFLAKHPERVWTTHGSSGAPFTRRGAGDVGNVEA